MTQTRTAPGDTALSPHATVGADRAAAARLLGRLGIGAAVVGALIIGVLHFTPPTSDISPVTRTISEYGLSTLAWAFNLGVVALAAGSLAVFAGLAMVRRLPSTAGVFGALWILGLLTIVLFPKHNWALGGASSTGQVHRMASLVAFLALPVAAMLIARRRRHRAATTSFWLGVLALAWFSPIVIAILTSRTAWWQAIPLGLVERGMALTEVIAVVAMGCYLISSARAPQPDLQISAATPRA